MKLLSLPEPALWLHVAPLLVRQGDSNVKMSKSKGTSLPVMDLLEEYGASALKVMYMNNSKNSAISFYLSDMSVYKKKANRIKEYLTAGREEEIEEHSLNLLLGNLRSFNLPAIVASLFLDRKERKLSALLTKVFHDVFDTR